MKDTQAMQLQLDLFAEPETDHLQLVHDAPAAASPEQQIPQKVEAEDISRLELLMTEGSRKVAFNVLGEDQRDALALAVKVVAHAKRHTYERAIKGEPASSFDWHRREPALSQAVGLLNTSFIDTNAIAMA